MHLGEGCSSEVNSFEKICSVDAGKLVHLSGRFLQVFRHFAFVQKAFQVLTSRSLYFYLGIDG